VRRDAPPEKGAPRRVLHIMVVLADANIPYAEEAFSTLGAVRTRPGRAITPEALRDVDLLIVRSITTVDARLLGGTSVRFVGTCTIGEDHIDKAYLASRGIGFASAPGCNANSVAEYIVAALLALADRHSFALEGKSLGIVGVGNVGGRVLLKAEPLGLRCVLNDPPLLEQSGNPKYRPIEEILDCDIVTLHVPLEKGGAHPTWHLADERFLRRMKPGAHFLNTARGAVCDNRALKAALEGGHLRGAVLDVWEGEPAVDVELLEMVDIATPHIAGYSFDGKVNGTLQVYEAACRCLGLQPAWEPAPLLPEPDVPELTVYSDEPDALPRAVRAVYDVMRDDAAMRDMLALPAEAQPAHFDRLRKEYPRRREFQNTRVAVTPPDEGLEGKLQRIGFHAP